MVIPYAKDGYTAVQKRLQGEIINSLMTRRNVTKSICLYIDMYEHADYHFSSHWPTCTQQMMAICSNLLHCNTHSILAHTVTLYSGWLSCSSYLSLITGNGAVRHTRGNTRVSAYTTEQKMGRTPQHLSEKLFHTYDENGIQNTQSVQAASWGTTTTEHTQIIMVQSPMQCKPHPDAKVAMTT